MRIARLTASIALFIATASGFAAAQSTYRLAHTFQRASPEPGDLFGTSVVLEGGVAAIKSDSGYYDGNGLSVTHIFEHEAGSGWTEAATVEVVDPDGELRRLRGNGFVGEELAIDGGEVAVGYSLTQGRYQQIQFARREYDGWVSRFNEGLDFDYLRTIPREEVPAGASGSAGQSVDISGGFAIATEQLAITRVDPRSRGVARIYERRSNGRWELSADLRHDDHSDFVPVSVALSGTTAAVINKSGGDSNDNAGLLFYQRLDNGEWVESQSFLESDTRKFFARVDLDGDTAIVEGTNRLSIYERDQTGVWDLTTRLTPDLLSRVLLGFAIDGDLLAQTVATGMEQDPYRVDLYHRTAPGEWSLLTSVHDPTPGPYRYFGSSVDLDGGRLLVGTSNALQSPLYEGRSVESSPSGEALLFVSIPEPAGLFLWVMALIGLPAARRR